MSFVASIANESLAKLIHLFQKEQCSKYAFTGVLIVPESHFQSS